MLLVQVMGLSGSGKTTLSEKVCQRLNQQLRKAMVIDGDVYRRTLCRDLGFSRADRLENIRRLAQEGRSHALKGSIVLIAAINPYEEGRQEVRNIYPHVRTIWLDCSLPVLIQRDTKGLYRRALLPEGHPERLENLTGVNDLFEPPQNYDLRLDTGSEPVTECVDKVLSVILSSSLPL